MGTSKNKTVRTNSNRKIVGAIRKHLTGNVTLAGEKYTPGKLGKMFQEGIDVGDATDVASNVWHAAVAKERRSTEDLSAVQQLLRNHVAALFGEASNEFADFGFTPRKVTSPDAATKADAVKKRAQTRVARHTMGKRQKAEITGENAPAVDASTAVALPVAPAATGDASGVTGSVPSATSQAVAAKAAAKPVVSA